MTPFVALVAALVLSLEVSAQAPPYWGGSDPGVLPMYLPKDTDNRLGTSETTTQPNKQLHGGTLETEAVYNRVAEWPDSRKPFWYVNANAIQKQREQQQQQRRQQQQQQRRLQQQRGENERILFSSSSSRGNRQNP